ncbi:unnamed protein product [Sphagnum jensenii]|uniref:Uncharacterized protein n=1 Tax=Sphagnum jensenii TaxID=128206 RepID=A0ABP0WFQ5_9BRYO
MPSMDVVASGEALTGARSGPVWLPDIFTKNEVTGKCNCGRTWSDHVFCITCRRSCLFRRDFVGEGSAHFRHTLLEISEDGQHRPVIKVQCMEYLQVDVSGIQYSYSDGEHTASFFQPNIFLYREADPATEIVSSKKAETAAAAAISRSSENRQQVVGDQLGTLAAALVTAAGRHRSSGLMRSSMRNHQPFLYCRKCDKVVYSDGGRVMFCSLQCKMETARDDPTVTLMGRPPFPYTASETNQLNDSMRILHINALWSAVQEAIGNLR